MPTRRGRKSAAQTPAPRSERIYGSKKNPKGTAASKTSAQKIVLSEKTINALSEKAKEYNKKHKDSVSLNTLKAVYRRGLGAYSSSHRPTITGGAPNTRNAWAMARVNKFLMKKSGKKVKAAYVQDDDLLAKGGNIFDDKALLKKYKEGKSIGFSAEAHLKAKGLLPRVDGTKRKSEKYKKTYEKRISRTLNRSKIKRKSVKKFSEGGLSESYINNIAENYGNVFWGRFGKNGEISWTIPKKYFEDDEVKYNSKEPTYIKVEWISTNRSDSSGEAVKAIKELFSMYPKLDKIAYDDQSQGFWDKIGGSMGILRKDNLFEDGGNVDDKIETQLFAKGGGVTISNEDYTFYVGGEDYTGKAIKIDGETVGGIAYDDEDNEIQGITIKNKYRNKGIAKKAIKTIFDNNKKLRRVYVRAIPKAKKFWEKIGTDFDEYNDDAGLWEGYLERFEDGGFSDELIVCSNCLWSWKASESTPEEKYICHKCGHDNTPTMDKITMDVPLFIRLLEYAREDAKDDMDLHTITENALKLGDKTLTMEDYQQIVFSKISSSKITKSTSDVVEFPTIEEEFADGGVVVGKRHSESDEFGTGEKFLVESTGQIVELEGGEGVLCKESMQSKKIYNFDGKKMTGREIASFLNHKYGGVEFAKGGEVDDKSVCGCRSMYYHGGELPSATLESLKGGEAVVTVKTMESKDKYSFQGREMTPRKILSHINQDSGGKKFEDGGIIDLTKHRLKNLSKMVKMVNFTEKILYL